MPRNILAALIALLMIGAVARAQIILPGSTVEGDYLRGVGFAAVGSGIYNYDTAVADSINTDTAIRWNEYVSAVSEYQSRKYATRREHDLNRQNQNYKAILQRHGVNPEERDVQTGDALNALMSQLLDPSVSESSFRLEGVPLSADVVRRIPFKLDAESVVFSMRRLTATGKERWPPALQDPSFASERRAYERALDAVLELQIEGKMTIDSIHTVEAAVEDLLRKLAQRVNPDADKKLYNEAKNRITEFQKLAKNLLKSHQMQLVIGQLDCYSGTTVRDLLVFMQGHKLGFAAAQLPDERDLYPELYAVFVEQRDRLKDSIKKPGS